MNDLNERVELYKLYVNSAERISAARMKANAFFLTLNVAPFVNFLKIDKSLALMFGILINICWFLLLRSYKKLNSAKFKVIQEMEENLPYPCFKMEEKYYKLNKRKDFSTIEKFVPIVIIFSYFMHSLLDWNINRLRCRLGYDTSPGYRYYINHDSVVTLCFFMLFAIFAIILAIMSCRRWKK